MKKYVSSITLSDDRPEIHTHIKKFSREVG